MKTLNNKSKDSKTQFQIQFEIEDKETQLKQTLKFAHTKHSLSRSDQRGISKSKISVALEYGTTFFKQGFIYHVLGEKNIPDSLQKEKKQYKNTVVVVSGDSNQVITCYRSSNSIKNLKHKSKELYQNYNNVA